MENELTFKKQAIKWVSIKKVKGNPNNPRKFNKIQLRKMIDSIKEDPIMLSLKPLIVDADNVVLGGNLRLRALKELKIKEVPTIRAEDVDEETKKRIVIKDNMNYGDWDFIDTGFWQMDKVVAMGIDPKLFEKGKEDIDNEVEFSEYLGEANNYVVLIFDNEVDWLSAQTHFEIKPVYSKRANGKPWSKGIGRVINGAEYIKMINKK